MARGDLIALMRLAADGHLQYLGCALNTPEGLAHLIRVGSDKRAYWIEEFGPATQEKDA